MKRNIIANIGGQAGSILISLVVFPFYINLMGMEGYGLVGFYFTLQAIFNSFLDLGISVTITREIARFSALPDKLNETRDLVRTLEIVYWLIGVFLGLAVMLGASWIAYHWLRAENMSPESVRQAVIAMGIATVFQWPLTFYQGGLVGLQKMVVMNVAFIGFTILRSVGAVLALRWVSPTVLVFFGWQIIAFACQVFFFAILLWRNLPASDHIPRFDKNVFVGIRRFMVGISATSFVTFFISTIDRIILSKILTLEFLGYYNLAATISANFQYLGSQIMRALFPTFSALAAKNDGKNLRERYHQSAQMISVAILPATVIFALFSPQLIYVWTQNSSTAMHTAPILSVLLIGTAINVLMNAPYYLTLAYGWTSLGFFMNLALSFLIAPLMIGLSLKWGGLGAAFAWSILNIGYLIVVPRIVHHRLLKGELKRWYVLDVGLPLTTSLIVAGIGRWIMPVDLSIASTIFGIFLVACITQGVAILFTPESRKWLLQRVGVGSSGSI
ncbi:MAG: polysaccharide biosynthesis protein [Anaerolineales bacterium]